MNEEKLKEALKFAKENGLYSITIDGVTMQIPVEMKPIEVRIQTDEEIAKAFGEDPFLGMTDEELLYYATPYFDELQEKKKLKQEALEKEQQVRNG